MLLTTNPSVLMAGLVAIASAAVFAIRYVQPKASREYDIIFAVMGLIYSVCLLLEGWRLIPLLFFAQVLVVVFGGFFAVETFRLRNQLVELSRQSSGRARRDGGFRRTYAPGGSSSSSSARSVINRQPGGARIRDARDPERSFENRDSRRRSSSGSQPRLTDGSGPPRSPRRRPRPPQPGPDVEVLEDQDYPQDYRDQDYRETEDYAERDWEQPEADRDRDDAYRSRAPRRRRPTRPGSDEDQDPRASSSPSRRRPPRLPDDEEEYSSRPRVIRPEQIEVVDDDEDYDEDL